MHLDTYYGAIERPAKDKEGNIMFDEEGNPILKIYYVIRKKVSDIKEGDIKKIVDDNIRKLFEETGLKKAQNRRYIYTASKRRRNCKHQ